MKRLHILFTLLLSALIFSCSNDDEMIKGNTGYLSINVATANGTHAMGTRALPADYKAKQLAVEILDASGAVVKSTDDASKWASTLISLKAGTYTVNVHSYNWDGNDSGRDVPFYAGSATVEIEANERADVDITCRLANVKVSVNFDEKVASFFKSAYVEVKSAVEGINNQIFTMGNETSLKSAYFPVGSLTATLHVVNKQNKDFTCVTEFTDVKARDHYILNYSVEDHGNGEFTVTANDNETTYTFNFTVNGDPSVAFNTEISHNELDIWATFAYVEGEISSCDIESFEDSKVKFQYKSSSDADWTVVDAIKSGSKYKATLTNLKASTYYSYRMVYVDDVNIYSGSSKGFTTDAAHQLPNSGFEDWCTVNKLNYACTQKDQSENLFWGSSNVNATVTQINGASGTTDAHSGAKAALLESKYVNVVGIKKFAAASLFAGDMPVVKGTSGASINFGRPFVSRPSGLKGYFKYSTDKVNRAAALKMPDGSDVPLTSDNNDLWSCYIALTTDKYTFDNSSQAQLNLTIKDFKSGNDPTVIAYGEVADVDCVQAADWTSFNVNLHYFDTTTKPKYIIVVISSSKYGDYFCGCDKSKLYIDDLELVYDEPQQ